MHGTLKLTGEDGNAIAILGRAKETFRQAGIPEEDIEHLIYNAVKLEYYQLIACIMDFAKDHGIDVE